MIRPLTRLSLRTAAPARNISSTASRRGGGGGAHWNEPTGHLWGEKPLPPGQSRKFEDWEPIYYFGFYGSLLLGAVGYYYKPDTTISTWAKNEAKRRMEERGDLPKYEPSGY